jgi:hypothetical protein
MRSEPHHASQRGNPFVDGIVQVVAEVASAPMLLGDLIASKKRGFVYHASTG